MNKKKLIEIKKRLLALGLVGIMLGTGGCSEDTNDKESTRVPIPEEYSHPEDFYKYAVVNGQATKLYNSSNVYFAFDKETYEVKEYLFSTQFTLLKMNFGLELYSLEDEELIAYGNGITEPYNGDYFDFIVENNYTICLNEVGNYIEGFEVKEYYSLEEIIELEPLVLNGLKLINEEKSKIKTINS